MVAALILAYALLSGRLASSPLTAPLFFTAAGLVLGSEGIRLFRISMEHQVLEILAEATLVFVLFTDAARIDLRRLRREFPLPLRLLLGAMPLQILLGALLAAWIFPELSFWQAGLLASILAPTDAALGQVVVTSPRVPRRLRQTLNVESGLNDGLALPVVTIFIATCLTREQALPLSHWLEFIVRQLAGGAACGVLVGWLGARLVDAAAGRDWTEAGFRQIAALSLAVAAFAGAHLIEGNGFLAAFLAGMVFGNSTRLDHGRLFQLAEEEGQVLTVLTFLLFGAVAAGPALRAVDGAALLYALLTLTVIRMAPTALALAGTGLRPASKLFVGWFGPRGLASILFGLLVVRGSGLAAIDRVLDVTFLTVCLSVLLHGVTANPGARWLEGRLRASVRTPTAQAEAPMAEDRATPAFPTRIMGGFPASSAVSPDGRTPRSS